MLVEVDFSEDIDQKAIEKIFKKEGTSMPLFLNSVVTKLVDVHQGLSLHKMVVVRICHENESSELNGHYLGKDYPTTVSYTHLTLPTTPYV